MAVPRLGNSLCNTCRPGSAVQCKDGSWLLRCPLKPCFPRHRSCVHAAQVAAAAAVAPPVTAAAAPLRTQPPQLPQLQLPPPPMHPLCPQRAHATAAFATAAVPAAAAAAAPSATAAAPFYAGAASDNSAAATDAPEVPSPWPHPTPSLALLRPPRPQLDHRGPGMDVVRSKLPPRSEHEPQRTRLLPSTYSLDAGDQVNPEATSKRVFLQNAVRCVFRIDACLRNTAQVLACVVRRGRQYTHPAAQKRGSTCSLPADVRWMRVELRQRRKSTLSQAKPADTEKSATSALRRDSLS